MNKEHTHLSKRNIKLKFLLILKKNTSVAAEKLYLLDNIHFLTSVQGFSLTWELLRVMGEVFAGLLVCHPYKLYVIKQQKP